MALAANIYVNHLRTVAYNRGTSDRNPGQIGIGTLTASDKDYIYGNTLESFGKNQAATFGNRLKAIVDAGDLFLSFEGFRWRQFRMLATGAYNVAPKTDFDTVFTNRNAGAANVAMDLANTDLKIGMRIRFVTGPVTSASTVITFSNGNYVRPDTGANGTVITISPNGFVTIMALEGALSGGAKVFVEEASVAGVAYS